MSLFEEELRKRMENSFYNARMTFPCICYTKVGDYIWMRVEFEGDGRYHYNDIKMTRVNYHEVEIDNYTLWFSSSIIS